MFSDNDKKVGVAHPETTKFYNRLKLGLVEVRTIMKVNPSTRPLLSTSPREYGMNSPLLTDTEN